MSGAGALIRQLRLERNFSQAGLARGICAASYLSKIEQGQAEASPEILERLFLALGVRYCTDSRLLARAETVLETYFAARERGEPTADQEQWLDANLDAVTYSSLSLWVGLYKAARAPQPEQARIQLEALWELRNQMTPAQQYRFWVLRAFASGSAEQTLEDLQQAERQKPCAWVRYEIALAACHMGRYSQSIEAAERAYQMAAEEGDLYVLIWASFLLGSCYTNRDMNFAEKYYRRAVRLGGKANPGLEDMVAYNLGASYLEWGQPEKARAWLTRTRPVEGNDDHNLLLYQKLAILHAQAGEPEQAAAALDRAEAILSSFSGADWQRSLYGDMLEFARQLLCDATDVPAYEALLLRLCADAGEKLGFGFRRFYGQYLIALYRSQRRYKDALRVVEELNREGTAAQTDLS